MQLWADSEKSTYLDVWLDEYRNITVFTKLKKKQVVLHKSPHNLELDFQLCYFQITPQASVDQTVIFGSSILLTS